MSNQNTTITVKLTTNLSHYTLAKFLPTSSSLLSGCTFVLNDETLEQADVWVVLDNFDQASEYRCKVPNGALVLAQYETAYTTSYFTGFRERIQWLDQFDQIFTFHAFNRPNVSFEPPFLPWMIDSSLETWMTDDTRSVDELLNFKMPEKTKVMSLIISDKTITHAQRQRLRFAEKAARWFGDDLDWFGSGVNPIRIKRDGLDEYHYHLALENRIQRGVFTEKFLDPLLAWSVPLYWGDPMIDIYFPKSSYISIDATMPRAALQRLTKIVSRPPSSKVIDAIGIARVRILNSMNFLSRLARIARDIYTKNLQDKNAYYDRIVKQASIPSHIGYRDLNLKEK